MRVVNVRSLENPEEYKEYLIPMGERLVVTDGLKIKAGDKITEKAILKYLRTYVKARSPIGSRPLHMA